ncbi:MAG: glycerophosphodiester phosphodiesterase [Terriglobales bacterium]
MALRPLLLGHRGARKYAPENTINAFECAIHDGCDGFELDVRLTSDLQSVVCHDPKFCGVPIARTTYQKLFEAASKKRKQISILERILGFGECAFLNIEVKVSGAEELLIALLEQYPPKHGVIVSSFLPHVIERLHELTTDVPLGLICQSRRQLARYRDLPIEAVMLHRALMTPKLFEELKSANKQVFVWTVNSAREMKKFAEMGVDGIISDDTRLLVQTLRPEFARRSPTA